MTTSLLFACVFLTIGLLCAVSAQPGGLGPSKDADPRANNAVDAVASQIRGKIGTSPRTKLFPVSYATQIVNRATNLFVKIRLGMNVKTADVVHAKIMEGPMGDKWNLVGLMKNKKESDRLAFFDDIFQ